MSKRWKIDNMSKWICNHWMDVILYIVFIVWLIIVIRRQTELRFLVEWGDESETIVVTKMMASGQRLYSEIYNNHGPLVFLPGFIISRLGDYFIEVYRWIPLVLQWLSFIAIFFSPLYTTSKQRIISTIMLGSIMVHFLSLIYGQTYLYQTISGLFMIIALVSAILPSLFKKNVSSFHYFIAVFLLMCLPFLAITNAPFAFLGLVIVLSRKRMIPFGLGIVTALMLNIGFIIIYGSWDGYIAYHFHLNFNVLYSGQGIRGFIMTILQFYGNNFTHFLTLMLIMIKVMIINHKQTWFDQIKGLFLIPMLVSLVVRGGDVFTLSGLMYLYALIGLSTVLFIPIEEEGSILDVSVQILPLIGLCAVATYLLTLPLDKDGFYNEFLPETEFSRIVERVTSPEDRILALSFRSYEYLVSDRLPASTHFIYLSIQAKYNQNPYKDIYVSIAEDVKKNRPKLMLIDEWNIILDDSDLWQNYASDLMQIVYEEYYQLKDKNIYVRKDLNLLEYGLDPYYGYIIE